MEGYGKTRVIELSKEEWLAQLLVAMWKQVGIEDIEQVEE
jgi:hypothetical protein